MENVVRESKFNKTFEKFSVEPQIKYPCYKSFDEFIDVKRLLSLNEYLIEGINRHIKTKQEDYFINLYRLNETMPYQPGVREIWLSRIKPEMPFECVDLVDQPDLWQQTDAAEEFSLLMDFIETLPFKEKGRMLIIYDDAGKEVPAHRDHLDTEICQEFIWLRTNLKKPFYFLNPETNEKKYVETYSAWFDSVNQYHGSDAHEGLSFSIRIDGKFTDEFRNKIPKPKYNPASTAALWACVEK